MGPRLVPFGLDSPGLVEVGVFFSRLSKSKLEADPFLQIVTFVNSGLLSYSALISASVMVASNFDLSNFKY